MGRVGGSEGGGFSTVECRPQAHVQRIHLFERGSLNAKEILLIPGSRAQPSILPPLLVPNQKPPPICSPPATLLRGPHCTLETRMQLVQNARVPFSSAMQG